VNIPNRIKLPALIVAFILTQGALAGGLEDPAVAIHQRVIAGDIQSVTNLLSINADINAKNELGWTPLHAAIRSNQKEEMIQLLLGKGADVNAKDNDGQTPMHFAVESGRNDIIQMLITKVANINETDNKGDNAMSLATKTRQDAIAAKLGEIGAQQPVRQASNDLPPRAAQISPMSPVGPADLDSSVSSPSVGRITGRIPRTFESSSSGSAEPQVNGDANDFRISRTGPSQIDGVLADPNEILARVKKYEGLEKAIQDVSDKSKAGMRQWRLTDNDNRNILVKAVQMQLDTEYEFLITTAKEEKAEQTVKAIEALRTKKTEWSKKVTSELTDKLREEKLTRTTTTTTTRSRTSSSSTTARGGSRGTTGRGIMMQPENNMQPGQPQLEQPVQPQFEQPIQPQSENSEWLEANVQDLDGRVNLAKMVNTQIMNEFGTIRATAVEEKAEKTVAAIDGVLLAMKQRFDDLYKYVDQLKLKQEKTQTQRGTRTATTTTTRSSTRSTTPSTGSRRGGR
jgi:hypothetical protein